MGVLRVLQELFHGKENVPADWERAERHSGENS